MVGVFGIITRETGGTAWWVEEEASSGDSVTPKKSLGCPTTRGDLREGMHEVVPWRSLFSVSVATGQPGYV